MTAIVTGWLIAAILAQRHDEDEGGWMKLLVFLVMAVFFIITNLVKARSRKRQEEQEEPEEGLTVQLPPMRRRPIPQPQAPTGPPKIFSHKMPEPVEEAPTAKLTAIPEAAKIEIPSAELIALEKHDELAKGIIYSEILGKPLALRESWGYE
jgi:hypothetical protein